MRDDIVDRRSWWFYGYFIILIFLSLSSLSISMGIKIRYNQLFILLLFGALFIDELINKRLNIPLLIILFGGGIFLSLISLNSVYAKIGEIKFIIKYIFIFPSAFYIGSRIFEKVSNRDFLRLIEWTVLFYAVIAFIFYFFPMPIFTKLAATAAPEGDLTTYRGTFSETGWFAVVIGAFLLSSISFRYDLKIENKNKIFLTLLYIFLIVSMAMSKNKTVWIAFVIIGISFIIFKSFANLFYSSYYQPKHKKEQVPLLKLFSPIRAGYIIAAIILFIIIFFSVNELLEKPIVSWHMIQVKLEQERGKAFLVIISLLKQSNWFGGYGFGFVESYFSFYGEQVIGLGKGVGMLFNSYLDSWISVSIFGLMFHILLLWLSFSMRFFFTMAIPIYFFIFANFNPATGSEYYYLFLGISYGMWHHVRVNDV